MREVLIFMLGAWVGAGGGLVVAAVCCAPGRDRFDEPPLSDHLKKALEGLRCASSRRDGRP